MAKKAAKITTTEDMVEKRKKFGFLIVVLGKNKCGAVIGNLVVAWTMPEDPGGYDEPIQAKATFVWLQQRGEKHTQKVIE